MIHIPSEVSSNQSLVFGDFNRLVNKPTRVWDAKRISFLMELSNRLMKSDEAKSYPDVISFAYWIRKSNLIRMKSENEDGKYRLGLGLTFHVCPSNVPINFAYSMVFGVISGNSCVLKLSSKEFDVIKIIIDKISEISSNIEFDFVFEFLSIVRYEHDDYLTSFWISISDAKVIWGGDSTVSHMRKFSSQPRSREIAFPDRYSICALSADHVIRESDDNLKLLAKKLYNDIYIMDQAACSSPQIFLWVGDAISCKKAKEILWPYLASISDSLYKPDSIYMMDKFVSLCELSITANQDVKILEYGDFLNIVEVSSFDEIVKKYRSRFGIAIELELEKIYDFSSYINEKFQTLTYFGFEREVLETFLEGARGIDRVVPIGDALDMSYLWDGFNMFHSLSRIVDIK